MVIPPPTRLVAILHSAPLGDGTRTLRRVETARDFLGCESTTVANLYPATLPNTNAFPVLDDESIWEQGRAGILDALDLDDAAAVLLGYGVSPPTGRQRKNYLQQVKWVEDELATRDIPVWTFGGRPAHPSRWHRIVHRESPGETVESAIANHLRQPVFQARK